MSAHLAIKTRNGITSTEFKIRMFRQINRIVIIHFKMRIDGINSGNRRLGRSKNINLLSMVILKLQCSMLVILAAEKTKNSKTSAYFFSNVCNLSVADWSGLVELRLSIRRSY